MNRLEELVHLCIGRASMCWSEIPTGTFDDVYAHVIAKDLLRGIEKHVNEVIANDRAVQQLIAPPHVIKDANGNVIAQSRGSL